MAKLQRKFQPMASLGIAQKCRDVFQQRYDRHYHPTVPNRLAHIIVDVMMAAMILGGVVTVAFLTLVYQNAVQRQQIETSFIPQRGSVTSGDDVSAHFSLHNNSGRIMKDATLAFPESAGFTLASSRPSLGDDHTIHLGNIDAGQTLGVDVTGTVIGEVGSSARINAVVRYTSASGSQEERAASAVIDIKDSALSLALDLPESLAIGKVFPFTLIVKNASSSASFANVLVLPDFPPAWQTVSTSLPTDPATSAWTIDRLASLETLTISGTANIVSLETPSIELHPKLYAAPMGAPYLQAEISRTVAVFAPRVTASAFSKTQVSLQLGAAADFVAVIKNREDYPLQQAHMLLRVSQDLINTADALLDVTGQAWATWHDGYLDMPIHDIPAGQDSSTYFPLTLRASVNPEKVFGDGAVEFRWDASLQFLHDGALITVPFEAFSLPIQTDLGLTASARYRSAEGETIGTGVWPPAAGQRTSVWIFLQPSNRLNPVSGATLTARLGNGVTFTGRQSVTGGSSVAFDGRGQLTWTIGSLPDYKTAFDGAMPSAAFEVSFTPADDEQAKQLLLLSDLHLFGQDTVAKTGVDAMAENITVSNVLDAR